MKLFILNLSSLIIAIVLLLTACEEKTISHQTESEIFVGVEYDPDLGVKHNELLNQWYEKHKTQLKGRSRSEKFMMVKDFIKEKYSMDVSGVKYKLFGLSPSVSNARINNVALNFDPYLIIDNNRNNMTTEVYSNLNTLFTQTENINTLTNEQRFLSSFENQVLNNNNLTTSEKMVCAIWSMFTGTLQNTGIVICIAGVYPLVTHR